MKLALWVARIFWVAVPFTLGDMFAEALDGYDSAFRTACSVGLWALWVATTLSLAVVLSGTLVVMRLGVATSLVAVGWLGIFSPVDFSTWQVLGGYAIATVATFASLAPSVGDAYVNATGYSTERRFLLRPPVTVVLGPVVVAGVACLAGLLAGPLLLAQGHWAVGVPVAVVGLVAVWWGYRSLLGLTRRWMIFVPAGIVIRDFLVFGAEAALMNYENIAELSVVDARTRYMERTSGWGTDNLADKPRGNQAVLAGDFTLGLAGAVVELRFRETVTFPQRERRRKQEQQNQPQAQSNQHLSVLKTQRIRIAPSSVAKLVAEAHARGIVIVTA